MSEVEVTQPDRDAAADLEDFCCGPKSQVEALRSGKVDGDYAIQSYARHRTASVEAATADLRERLAECEGVLRECREQLPTKVAAYADDDGLPVGVPNPTLAKIDALLGEPK